MSDEDFFGPPPRGDRDPPPIPPGPDPVVPDIREIPPVLPDDSTNPVPIIIGGLPAVAIPFPSPRPTAVPTFPSPSVPAANDPVFKLPGQAASEVVKGLGRALGVVGAALTLKELLEQIEERLEEDKELEREAKVRGARERIRRQREFSRDVRTEAGPADSEVIVTAPAVFPAPAPLPSQRPIGDPLPDIQPAPAPAPSSPTLPGVSPDIDIPVPTIPRPSTQPAPATTPAPRRAPAPRPGPVPASRPGALPAFFPVLVPVSFPSLRPVGDPSTNPINLTDIVPSVPPSVASGPSLGFIQLPTPQAQPATDPARCREVKRRRRRKGKCKEGFFREFPNKTQFVEWREVDCITRSKTDDFPFSR